MKNEMNKTRFMQEAILKMVYKAGEGIAGKEEIKRRVASRIKGTEWAWDTLTEAGYGDKLDGTITEEEVCDAVLASLKDDDVNIGTWTKSQPVITGTPRFIDDGLHQGLSVEFLEDLMIHAMQGPLFAVGVKDLDKSVWEAALASAIAFRDNDPEGYAKMHGGV